MDIIVSMTDNNYNNKEDTPITGDEYALEFINQMNDLVAPLYDDGENHVDIDDTAGTCLREWRENMISLNIDPDSPAVRASAIAALSMLAFDQNHVDTDNNEDTLRFKTVSILIGMIREAADDRNSDDNESTDPKPLKGLKAGIRRK